MTTRIFGDGTKAFNEDIVLCLMQEMGDSALASFSSTCRQAYILGKPILRVRKLFATYTKIHTNEDTIAPLIQHLRQHSDVRDYVKKIYYKCKRSPTTTLLQRELFTGWNTMYNPHFLKHHIQTSTVITPEDKLRWLEMLRARHLDGVAFLTLLGLCPSATEVQYHGHLGMLHDCLFPMTDNSSFVGGAQPRISILPTSSVDLSSLKTISLISSIPPTGNIIWSKSLRTTTDDVIRLMSLPSLTNFYICGYVISASTCPINSLPTINASDIDIDQCDIYPNMLARIVRQTPNLNVLVYTHPFRFHGYIDLINTYYGYKAFSVPDGESPSDCIRPGEEEHGHVGAYAVSLRRETMAYLRVAGLEVISDPGTTGPLWEPTVRIVRE